MLKAKGRMKYVTKTRYSRIQNQPTSVWQYRERSERVHAWVLGIINEEISEEEKTKIHAIYIRRRRFEQKKIRRRREDEKLVSSVWPTMSDGAAKPIAIYKISLRKLKADQRKHKTSTSRSIPWETWATTLGNVILYPKGKHFLWRS